MLHVLNKLLGKFHYKLEEINKSKGLPTDFEELHKKIWHNVKPFTMTSPERVFALIESVQYILKNKIEGAMVECGVWKGGSMMTVIETLKHHHVADRELYLYDTFEGMSAPTDKDVDYSNSPASKQLAQRTKNESDVVWAYSPLESVQNVITSTGYPGSLTHFIKGKVEDTIPANLPGKIALLRLDTDWYESTRHELIHLFPLLSNGGVLIIDDYGHWAGARQAVDEYIQEHQLYLFLHRIDNTGRMAIVKTNKRS